MLALFVLLLAVIAASLFGAGLSLSSMLLLAAVIVIVWSGGAILPAWRERRRG